MDFPFDFAELRRRPDYPTLGEHLATSNRPRAEIGAGYEQMPASTNIEDRRNEHNLVTQLVHMLTGFTPDQWAQVYRAPFDPMTSPPPSRPPHLTSDPLAIQAGYNDIPKVYDRTMPVPSWWTR